MAKRPKLKNCTVFVRETVSVYNCDKKKDELYMHNRYVAWPRWTEIKVVKSKETRDRMTDWLIRIFTNQ